MDQAVRLLRLFCRNLLTLVQAALLRLCHRHPVLTVKLLLLVMDLSCKFLTPVAL